MTSKWTCYRMGRIVLHTFLLALPVLLCTGCDIHGDPDGREAAAADTCRTVQMGIIMPQVTHETSGLAVSGRDPEVFWTHNDRGNEAHLYAVRSDGTLASQVIVGGAEHVDWEDIERAPCASGTCLYIADIGDNDGSRESMTIYEVPEPELAGDVTVQARALHARYPDGPHNAESIFILPGGDLFIVTKGDDGPVALYRYPAAARGAGAGAVVVLERVREAMARPENRLQRVTGASASPDGRHVAIRTYGALFIHAADSLVGAGEAVPISTIDLRPLQEPQGEGVAITNDGTVWLSSEAAGDGAPQLARLGCTLPH